MINDETNDAELMLALLAIAPVPKALTADPLELRIDAENDLDGSRALAEADARSAEIATYLAHAEQIVENLRSNFPLETREGSVWLRLPIRESLPLIPILRGYVEPARYRAARISKTLAYCLIKIDGFDEQLIREMHDHIKWHYHYVNERRERSDVILCWDTLIPVARKGHPLFYEWHSEGKSKFGAKPDTWGEKKRKSTHDACIKDLSRRDYRLEEFRQPKKEAKACWPDSAILTVRKPTVGGPYRDARAEKRKK